MNQPKADEGRWGQPMQYQLTELEAFDAMIKFLDAYWRRGNGESDDIAVLLGNISRDTWASRRPLDIAQWEDWLDAIAAVKTTKPGSGLN